VLGIKKLISREEKRRNNRVFKTVLKPAKLLIVLASEGKLFQIRGAAMEKRPVAKYISVFRNLQQFRRMRDNAYGCNVEVGDSRFDSMGESIRGTESKLAEFRFGLGEGRILPSSEFRKLFWFRINEPITLLI